MGQKMVVAVLKRPDQSSVRPWRRASVPTDFGAYMCITRLKAFLGGSLASLTRKFLSRRCHQSSQWLTDFLHLYLSNCTSMSTRVRSFDWRNVEHLPHTK